MAQYTGKEWCFTFNPVDPEDEDDAEAQGDVFYYHVVAGVEEGIYDYLCIAGEIGDSGNWHLQGYVMFKNTMTRNGIKALWDCDHLHLEKRAKLSTPLKASNYVCHRGPHVDKTNWDRFPLLEAGALPQQPCLTTDEAINRTKKWIDSIFEDPTFLREMRDHWKTLTDKYGEF